MTRADEIRAAAEIVSNNAALWGELIPTRTALAARLREYAYTIEMVENNLRYWGESKRMKGLVEMADALKGETK